MISGCKVSVFFMDCKFLGQKIMRYIVFFVRPHPSRSAPFRSAQLVGCRAEVLPKGIRATRANGSLRRSPFDRPWRYGSLSRLFRLYAAGAGRHVRGPPDRAGLRRSAVRCIATDRGGLPAPGGAASVSPDKKSTVRNRAGR